MSIRKRNLIDVWLNKKGYYRKHIPLDDSSLFRSVSDQVFNTQKYHVHIRQKYIEYVNNNHKLLSKYIVNQNWNEYLVQIRRHSIVCGNVEIQILSKMYKRDFIIFDTNNFSVYNITNNKYKERIMLGKIQTDHYDSIYRKDYIENLGFCQSLVYKLLYEDVLELDDVDQSVNIMLHSGDEMEHFEKLSLPFPYKVAKALDPNQYRNVEFDAWNQSRRDTRLEEWYMGDNNFKVGTKCLWSVGGKEFVSYIQEMDKEMCFIYVVETAERRQVHLSELKATTDAKPWPVRYAKNRAKNYTLENRVFRPNKKRKQQQQTKQNPGPPQLGVSVEECSTELTIETNEVTDLIEININHNDNNNNNEDFKNMVSGFENPSNEINIFIPSSVDDMHSNQLLESPSSITKMTMMSTNNTNLFNDVVSNRYCQFSSETIPTWNPEQNNTATVPGCCPYFYPQISIAQYNSFQQSDDNKLIQLYSGVIQETYNRNNNNNIHLFPNFNYPPPEINGTDMRIPLSNVRPELAPAPAPAPLPFFYQPYNTFPGVMYQPQPGIGPRMVTPLQQPYYCQPPPPPVPYTAQQPCGFYNPLYIPLH